MVCPVASDQLLDNRYRIVEILGESQWGCTLRVEDTHQADEHRVIRQLRVPFAQTELYDRARQLCQQEFDFLQRLQHPQVPQFYNFFAWEGESERWFCVVQEVVVGLTLRQWLHDREPEESQVLSEAEAAQFLQQVLNGVGYIHTQGVIHRNLSPDNLIRRAVDGRFVLIDFGGMKHILTTLSAEARGDITTHNAVGAVLAEELPYAPLEQVQKGILYTYSDIYAIAGTVMLSLTGQEPHQLRDRETGEWDWSATPLHCDDLQKILARMLARHPSDRPQSVHGIIQDLRRIPQDVLSLPETGQGAVLSATKFERHKASETATLGARRGVLLMVLGLLFATGAGALGWGIGQLWIRQQVVVSDIVPDLELSPELELSEANAQVVDFPLVDDGEPEPDEQLSAAERDRKLELRDRRRQLGIDYEFFQDFVQYVYGESYPDRAGRFPSNEADDASLRTDWDAVSQNCLEQLSQLSSESRRRLGDYSSQVFGRWQQELARQDIAPSTLELLTTATFETYFPEKSPDSNTALRQLWRAIAFEHVQALRSGESVEGLTTEPDGTALLRSGELEPNQSQLYTVELEGEQRLVANLVSDQAATLMVQAPNGEALLKPDVDRLWSGLITEPGTYRVTVLSRAVDIANFQLYVTVE